MRRALIVITLLASVLAWTALPASAATFHHRLQVGESAVFTVEGSGGGISVDKGTTTRVTIGSGVKVLLREDGVTGATRLRGGSSGKFVLWHVAGSTPTVTKSGSTITVDVGDGSSNTSNDDSSNDTTSDDNSSNDTTSDDNSSNDTSSNDTSSNDTTSNDTTSNDNSSASAAGFGAPYRYVTPEKAAATKRHQIGFSVDCDFSHSLKDDPIVWYAKPGRSHLHDFFGSVVTDANTRFEDLRNSKTTCTSRDDQTAYWFPAVYQNGKKVTAKTTTFYYKPGVSNRKSIEPIPLGLQMIAGNAAATGPQDAQYYWWQEFRNARNNTSSGKMITANKSGKITLKVVFPDCWDGKRLSAPNQAHMKYHTNKRKCPASHPVPIPQVTTYVTYNAKGGSGLTLASGQWFTMHADFFNAWHPTTQQKLIDECIVPYVRCGNVYDFDSKQIPNR